MRPPAPSTNNWNGDEALNKVLAGGGTDAPWELVGDGFGFTDGACGDAEGNCYFSDLPKGLIYRVAAGATKAEPWLTNGPKVSGLKLGPDGQFYAATQGDAPKIVAIDPKTQALRDVATGVKPNDLIVSKAGWIYFTDTGAGQVQAVPIGAKALSRPRTVAGGITSPNGIALSPKQDFLYVSEYGGTNVWSFAIAGDGSTVDALGRLYVTSHAGVQMFDWSGRLGGVIAKPRPDKGVYSCVFAGPGRAYLYVCGGDAVHRRKTLTTAP
jgi:enterochelin esterase family protein